MTRFRINIVLLVVYLVCTGAASAEWYQVELIVFENINAGFDNEDFYKDPGLVALNNTVKPVDTNLALPGTNSVQGPDPATSTAVKPLVPYEVLPESRYQLQGIYQALRQSQEYRPHYHVAWQQPGYDGNMARAVHLQQEDRGSSYESTLPLALMTDPVSAEFYEPVKLLLDGTVRIRSSAFLYVDIDMLLFRSPANNLAPLNIPAQGGPQSPQSVPEQQEKIIVGSIMEKPAEYIRLKEIRRIKLNEIQYFDHPRFGVILQVSRLEEEDVGMEEAVRVEEAVVPVD